MMRSSRGRRDPVAASIDVAFENRPSLAFDAQIDSGLCCSTAGSVSQREENGIILAFVLAHSIVPSSS